MLRAMSDIDYTQPMPRHRGPQGRDPAAIARVASRARKVPQQAGLILPGVVGQRGAAHRARGAHDRRDTVTNLRIGDERIEDIRRTLRVADQHQARAALLDGHRHDRVANLARILCGARQQAAPADRLLHFRARQGPRDV